MRLLDINKFQLCSFEDERKAPPYAILSHTWGENEVTFDEITGPRLSEDVASQGVKKILMFTEQAKKAGYDYVWVDTCTLSARDLTLTAELATKPNLGCIQKSSSAELSEAINSMFRWYKRSAVCYAYLNDVPPRQYYSPTHAEALFEGPWLEKFSASRWFTRGWTLQELIAPRRLTFFSAEWEYMGTKDDLAQDLTEITGIPQDTLLHGDAFGQSVSRRMSWAAKRQTTRVEDTAYCLLGIFNINMPLLYGEGKRAFQRLQEEIIKITVDETIFAWKAETSGFANWRSLFASSPVEFADSADFVPSSKFNFSLSHSYSITNQGLQIMLPLTKNSGVEKGWRSGTEFIATLKAWRVSESDRSIAPVGISIKKIFGNEFVRVDPDQLHMTHSFARNHSTLASSEQSNRLTPVCVRQRVDYAPWYYFHKCFRIKGAWIKNTSYSAKLLNVSPEKNWQAAQSTFMFDEVAMREGQRQVIQCFFSLGDLDGEATLALHFNPKEEYRGICCYYEVVWGSMTVDIESLVRVMDGDAVLAVGLKVS